MFRKKTKSLFIIAGLTAWVSIPASAEALNEVGNFIHSSGETVSGLLITENTERRLGPISTLNLYSLKTEFCGILDFQASPVGLTCLNCRENSAVLTECRIPRTNSGWHLLY